MKNRRFWGTALSGGMFALLLALLLGAGCDIDLGRRGSSQGPTAVGTPPSPPSRVQTAPARPRRPKGLATYRVDRVLDGDTIILSDGTKVRYIGVDTPESVHPSKPVEHYGPEASKANKRLLLGKRVGIQYDAERKDRYGRTLAYVWLGNTLVNAWLVERGYARTMTIKPNVKYARYFTSLEATARKRGEGRWAGSRNERSRSY